MRVGVGSTRLRLFRRRVVGLVLLALAATIRFADVIPLEQPARPRLVPGQPGLHTQSFAIAADGTRIATTDLDGSVALRDSRNGWAFERFPTTSGYVRSVSLSPEGRFLVCTADDSSVALYDLHSRGAMRRLSVPLDRVHRVEYAPDGRSIAIASDHDDPLLLWDVIEDRVTTSLPVAGQVVELAFSADGRHLASGENQPGSAIVLWDLQTRGRRFVEKGGDPVTTLALSRDGRWLAAARGYGRFVRIWDATSSTLMRELDGRRTGTLAVAFAPDGMTLATAGNDGKVRLWNRSTGLPQVVLDGDAEILCRVAFSPDGRWIAAMSRDDYHLRVWELDESVALAPAGRLRLPSASPSRECQGWHPVVPRQP